VKVLMGLLIASVQMALGQSCSTNEATVIAYGNGIRRTPTQAANEAAALQDAVTPLLSPNGINPGNVTFCVIYDGTYVASIATALGPAGTVIHTPLQFLQSAIQVSGQYPQQFWYWLSNRSAAPAWFNQIEQDIGTAIGTGTSTLLQPDIFAQLQIYQTALQNNQQVVAVAHSQGNLYLNQAYDLLFPSTSSQGISLFHTVAVATPADRVAGNGPYTTLLRDPIYLVPGSLTWNVDNGPCIDNSCYSLPFAIEFHDFTTSYLDGSTSGPLILGQIVSIIPPEASFVGLWNNPNPLTGITQAQFTLNGSSIVAHMWGDCIPTACDWGEVSAPPSSFVNGVLALTWNQGFAIKTQKCAILSNGQLQVLTHTHFIDNSGRKDYDETDYFTRKVIILLNRVTVPARSSTA
jgi:hypothetical protein